MLSDLQMKGVLSFVGYGSPSAPLWFIGAEEGLGGTLSGRSGGKPPRWRPPRRNS